MKKSFIKFILLFSLVFISCSNLFLIEETHLYKVTFEVNEGTPVDSYRTDCIEKSPLTQKEDATFAGWYVTADFTDERISFPYALKKDTTLYARWTQRYAVHFVSNGGTEIPGYKTDVIETAPDITQEGFYFAGWYETSDFGCEEIQFPYHLTENKTLYAKWIKISHVKFESNGGSEISDMNTAIITSSPESIRTGYILYGWYKEPELQNKISFPYTLTGDSVFYAKWTANSNAKYTVEHYKQDLSLETDSDLYILCDSENLTGMTDSLSQAISKDYEGYSVKEIIQSPIAGDGSTVIKIYYERKKFTVNFNANGGIGAMQSQTFYYGVQQKIQTNSITKSGNTFIGWAESEEGPVIYNNAESIYIESNKTLYAKWYYGITVTNSDINNLNLSELTESYTVKVSGKISNSSLINLAEKISASNVDIILDLTDTEGLEAIGADKNNQSTFINCTKLTSIILPETVTTIGSYAFYKCSSLTTVVFPESIKTIGQYAFSNCKNLTSVEIKNAETIGQYAFSYCDNIDSVKIDNIETIQQYAFYYSYKITSVNLKNIKTIGSRAFNYCSNLINAYLENIETISDNVFGNYTNSNNYESCKNLTSLTLKNIKNIGRYAFAYSEQLNDIVIQDVTTIGVYAFAFCSNLYSINIDAVSIGRYAFEGCTVLTAVKMSKRVSEIQNYSESNKANSVFKNCTSLTSVTFEDTDSWYYKQSETRFIKLDVHNASTNAEKLASSGYAWVKN